MAVPAGLFITRYGYRRGGCLFVYSSLRRRRFGCVSFVTGTDVRIVYCYYFIVISFVSFRFVSFVRSVTVTVTLRYVTYVRT